MWQGYTEHEYPQIQDRQGFESFGYSGIKLRCARVVELGRHV